MDNVCLYNYAEDTPDIKEINFKNTGATERNVYEAHGIHYSDMPSNNRAQHTDNPETLEIEGIKTEDIDIFEQFIDENGIQNRKEYEIKSEIGTNVPSEELYEAEYYSEIKSEETHHPEKKDFNVCPYRSEKVVVTSAIIGSCVENSSSGSVSNPKAVTKIHRNTVNQFIKKHICYICKYAANHKKNLKQHIDSVHLDLKQHKCDFCDYTTNHKGHLKIHLDSVHLNLKQHKCELCDYATSQTGHLKQHVDSVHLNLKQHKCKLCDYAASKKNNLKQHVDSVHLNLKHHKCELCNYATNIRANLITHINSIHLNLKQHKCELCDYAANREAHLKRHIDSVHLNLKQHY